MTRGFHVEENLPKCNKHLIDNLITSLPIPPFKELATLSPFEGILHSLEVVYDGLIEQLKVASIVLQAPALGVTEGKGKLRYHQYDSVQQMDLNSHLGGRICKRTRSYFSHA